jgi:cbb3-type cytochrome oxidase maturation protein
MGSLTFLIVISLTLGIGAWLFFVWSVRSGQYDDVEEPKHRMLDDDDDDDRGPGAAAPSAETGPAVDGGAVRRKRPAGRTCGA